MRREPLLWLVALGVLVAAFFVSVAALNATVYSANGFVRGYLDALERHDSAAALEAIGYSGSASGSDALLTNDAMGDISSLELVRDTPGEGGTHTVVFDFVFGTPSATKAADNPAPQRTEFTVVQTGSRFGLFPTWKFVASPLSTLSVTVLNVDNFTANGVTVTTTIDAPTSFLAFAPGNYELAHDSTYLSAGATAVPIISTGAIVDATVAPEPTAALIDWTADATQSYLDECATQTVLMPTGCPFGESFSNRIDTAPQWSMVDYPTVALEPARQPGTWMTRSTDGVAHLVVTVRSLFDGTLSRFDEDIPFDSQFSILFFDGEPVLRFVEQR